MLHIQQEALRWVITGCGTKVKSSVAEHVPVRAGGAARHARSVGSPCCEGYTDAEDFDAEDLAAPEMTGAGVG